jgi:hypothetical protein
MFCSGAWPADSDRAVRVIAHDDAWWQARSRKPRSRRRRRAAGIGAKRPLRPRDRLRRAPATRPRQPALLHSMDTKSVQERDRARAFAQRRALALAVADDSFRPPAVAPRATIWAKRRSRRSGAPSAVPDDRGCPQAYAWTRALARPPLSDSSSRRAGADGRRRRRFAQRSSVPVAGRSLLPLGDCSCVARAA